MVEQLIYEKLNERIKELKCIYSVEELFADHRYDLDIMLRKLLDIIPAGWQFTTICEGYIRIEEKEYTRPDFVRTEWFQRADLVVDDSIIGEIAVYYRQKIDKSGGKLFLPEEQKLLDAIADRLSHYIFFQRLKDTIDYFDTPVKELDEEKKLLTVGSDIHWKWRYRMAQLIADQLDTARFGVEAVYIAGSTKTAQAGPSSDIDLIIHFIGNEWQECELRAWIEGWSLCIAEINYLRTGVKNNGGLVDLHLVTNEDLKNKTSFAVMIDPKANQAHCLRRR